MIPYIENIRNSIESAYIGCINIINGYNNIFDNYNIGMLENIINYYDNFKFYENLSDSDIHTDYDYQQFAIKLFYDNYGYLPYDDSQIIPYLNYFNRGDINNNALYQQNLSQSFYDDNKDHNYFKIHDNFEYLKECDDYDDNMVEDHINNIIENHINKYFNRNNKKQILERIKNTRKNISIYSTKLIDKVKDKYGYVSILDDPNIKSINNMTSWIPNLS